MVTVAAIRTTRKFARVAVRFTANLELTGLLARWAQDRSLRIAGPERRETVPASFFLFFHQRRARLLPIPEGTGFRREEFDENELGAALRAGGELGRGGIRRWIDVSSSRWLW